MTFRPFLTNVWWSVLSSMNRWLKLRSTRTARISTTWQAPTNPPLEWSSTRMVFPSSAEKQMRRMEQKEWYRIQGLDSCAGFTQSPTRRNSDRYKCWRVRWEQDCLHDISNKRFPWKKMLSIVSQVFEHLVYTSFWPDCGGRTLMVQNLQAEARNVSNKVKTCQRRLKGQLHPLCSFVPPVTGAPGMEATPFLRDFLCGWDGLHAFSALGPASGKSNLTWQAHVTLAVPICPESRRWENPARTRSWTRTDWITLHAYEEHETSPPHNSRTELWPARLRGLFINRKVWVTFPPSRSMRIFMRVVLLTTEAVSFYESRALLGQNRFWSCDPFVNTCIRAIYDTDKYIFYFRVP